MGGNIGCCIRFWNSLHVFFKYYKIVDTLVKENKCLFFPKEHISRAF